uniref:Uncharacterized protein n=1 Tax=Anguilla anguilla TaxID=7936 RepID=A0A0E9XTX2_ANGAN
MYIIYSKETPYKLVCVQSSQTIRQTEVHTLLNATKIQ